MADNDKAHAAEIPAARQFADESARVDARRATVGLTGHPAGQGRWALALSGGGIRSATFSLGVLQALAAVRPAPATAGKPLLWHFDYLSTVSGGGYIGGFFCSLFVPGRLRTDMPRDDSALAARTAYDALTYEPPGRLRHESYGERGSAPGQFALAWLRDNGRYLAPTGSGDLFYASALAVRNWVSLHFVLGTVILAAFAAVALARSLAAQLPWVGEIDAEGLAASLACPRVAKAAELCAQAGEQACTCEWGALVWWSTLLALPLAIAVFAAVPAGVAYWVCHPHHGENANSPSRRLTWAFWATLAATITFALLGLAAWSIDWTRPALLTGTLAVVALAGALIHLLTAGARRTVGAQRVAMTRLFSTLLMATLAAAVLALVDTAGQTLYRVLTAEGAPVRILSLPALVAAIVWVVRKSSRFFDEKEKAGAAWLAKVPVEWLAGLAGIVMLGLLAILWQLLVQWIEWAGGAPDPYRLADPERAAGLAMLAGFIFFIGWIVGRFPGFINLSSLQWLYGSRLTRAYLGGSNGARFESSDHRLRSAAEPHPGDELSHEAYYAPTVAAPLHLINVTMNLTVDPVEQLVQRDRKGKPLAVGPFGFSLDGRHFAFAHYRKPHENQLPMTMGQWIGTSGAAFTTGLGRSTSLGLSLALGLANVRLGTWWDSGRGVDRSGGLERLGKALFKSQTFLGYELLAQFHGTSREWQYLSDGGHFENTGIYELLRPERRVRLIVASDNGCDARYQFDDLANLIRLARIDHRIELEVVSSFPEHPELAAVFGHPAEFTPDHPGKCAVMLTASPVREDGVREAVGAVVVLLKPRLVPGASADVRQYAVTHPPFPQEPTADQFFDEAQWESYRRLGRDIALAVFGGATGARLWDYLDTHPALRTPGA